MVDKTTKLTRMGRRRFLRTLSAMGLSAETVRYMTKERLESLTGDPTEEVPRLRALRVPDPERWAEPPFPTELKDREPEFYTISRDQWIQVESAYDAARRLRDRLEEVFAPGKVAAGVTKTNSGGHERYAVSVSSITPSSASDPDITRDDLKGVLPDRARGTVESEGKTVGEVEDIPIVISERFIADEGCDNEQCEHVDVGNFHYDSPYRVHYSSFPDGVMAGCAIRWERDDTVEGACTLGIRVSDGDETKSVTAAHCPVDRDDDNDSSDAIGRTVYQNDDGYSIGEVDAAAYHRTDGSVDYPMDAATVEYRSSLLPSDRLAAQSSGDSDGHLATDRIGEDRLRDMPGEEYICRQGIRSGRCEGYVTEVTEYSGGYDIKMSRDYSDGGGNSGGPYFVEDDGDLLVVGIHRAGSYRDDPDFGRLHYAHGIFAGDIEDQFDVEVR